MFICEYVGELVPEWEGNRRALKYMVDGEPIRCFDKTLTSLVRT
jgi:hypothetical protein